VHGTGQIARCILQNRVVMHWRNQNLVLHTEATKLLQPMNQINLVGDCADGRSFHSNGRDSKQMHRTPFDVRCHQKDIIIIVCPHDCCVQVES
jgi:hypothetical protein